MLTRPAEAAYRLRCLGQPGSSHEWGITDARNNSPVSAAMVILSCAAVLQVGGAARTADGC